MKGRPVRTLILAAAAGFLLISPLRAEEAFYLGTWKLDSAVVTPWADPHDKPDATEMKSLVGKTISVTPAAITGPKVFACKGPHYKLSNFTADLLFQGAFGEMRDNDKSVDPQKLAASLGFSGASFKTLETGCEFDWHFVNPTTADIGLNDYVYTLKKQ